MISKIKLEKMKKKYSDIVTVGTKNKKSFVQ